MIQIEFFSISKFTLLIKKFVLKTNQITFTAYGYPLELPTFEWVDMSTLKIVYPNGNVDFAPLKSYNPIPVGPNERAEDVDLCIFTGYLTEEENVHITLAGCPFTNNFQVIFFVNFYSFIVKKAICLTPIEIEAKCSHLSLDFLGIHLLFCVFPGPLPK